MRFLFQHERYADMRRPPDRGAVLLGRFPGGHILDQADSLLFKVVVYESVNLDGSYGAVGLDGYRQTDDSYDSMLLRCLRITQVLGDIGLHGLISAGIGGGGGRKGGGRHHGAGYCNG